jgi:hypothetical protein
MNVMQRCIYACAVFTFRLDYLFELKKLLYEEDQKHLSLLSIPVLSPHGLQANGNTIRTPVHGRSR